MGLIPAPAAGGDLLEDRRGSIIILLAFVTGPPGARLPRFDEVSIVNKDKDGKGGR
jgi:hypothetical protein